MRFYIVQTLDSRTGIWSDDDDGAYQFLADAVKACRSHAQTKRRDSRVIQRNAKTTHITIFHTETASSESKPKSNKAKPKPNPDPEPADLGAVP